MFSEMKGELSNSLVVPAAASRPMEVAARLPRYCAAMAFLIAASGCSAEEPDFLGGNLYGYNHTSSSVVSFSIDGYGGGRTRPFGESGAVCCVSLPRKWRPRMMMEVKWLSDPNAQAAIAQVGTQAFSDFMVEHEKKYRWHTVSVEVPQYDRVCGMEVHFLSCNEVKLSTSCWGYSSPKNPIKEPMRMEEPSVCPSK